MKKGRLFWITGLSGAGKSTISELLYAYLKKQESNVVFLDGDIVREVFQNKDYTPEGREKITYTYMRLCKMLTDQGIDVVAAFIAMQEEYRKWNRQNIENYYEVYLQVPMEELIRRDSKGLYKKALNHEIENVYGIDMAYEEPQHPDVRIVNDLSKTPQEILDLLIAEFKL